MLSCRSKIGLLYLNSLSATFTLQITKHRCSIREDGDVNKPFEHVEFLKIMIYLKKHKAIMSSVTH